MPGEKLNDQALLKAKVVRLAQQMLDAGLAIESKDAEHFYASPFVGKGGGKFVSHPHITAQYFDNSQSRSDSIIPLFIIAKSADDETQFIAGVHTFKEAFINNNHLNNLFQACKKINLERKCCRGQTARYLVFSGTLQEEEARLEIFNQSIQDLIADYDVRFKGICAYNQAKCALSKYYENDTTDKKENLFRLMDSIRENLRDIYNLPKDTLNTFKKNLSELEIEVSRLNGEARRCQSASRGARALINFLSFVRLFISWSRIDAKIDSLAKENTQNTTEREKHAHAKQSIQLFQSAINVKNIEKAINTALRKKGA